MKAETDSPAFFPLCFTCSATRWADTWPDGMEKRVLMDKSEAAPAAAGAMLVFLHRMRSCRALSVGHLGFGTLTVVYTTINHI